MEKGSVIVDELEDVVIEVELNAKEPMPVDHNDPCPYSSHATREMEARHVYMEDMQCEW